MNIIIKEFLVERSKMLSDVGWLNVFSIMAILLIGCSFGLYYMYKARKSKTKLLFYMGLAIFFNGLWYWGNFWESLSILITGENFDNIYGIAIPYEVQAIMSYIWVPISNIFYVYVAVSIITPRIKRYITGFFLILAIIWWGFLLLDPLNSLSILIPPVPGSDFVDEDLILGSPISQIANVYIIFSVFFIALGYLFKGIKAKEVIRKKYLYLSIGSLLSVLFAILEGFGAQGVTLFFTRAGFVAIFWFYYLGLREEQVKVKIQPTEKEISIEDSIFRIAKRPAQITEEEVTYYREQKICMICKGKVSGFNIFLCRSCDTTYHEKCARALSITENACWVCNVPIDDSKPSKPFKIESTEAESIDIEKSKK